MAVSVREDPTWKCLEIVCEVPKKRQPEKEIVMLTKTTPKKSLGTASHSSHRGMSKN